MLLYFSIFPSYGEIWKEYTVCVYIYIHSTRLILCVQSTKVRWLCLTSYHVSSFVETLKSPKHVFFIFSLLISKFSSTFDQTTQSHIEMKGQVWLALFAVPPPSLLTMARTSKQVAFCVTEATNIQYLTTSSLTFPQKYKHKQMWVFNEEMKDERICPHVAFFCPLINCAAMYKIFNSVELCWDGAGGKTSLVVLEQLRSSTAGFADKPH